MRPATKKNINTVVWAAQGHGKSVLEQFYQKLSPDKLSNIKAVTGDGTRWITDCVNEFTPDYNRCIDPFHVVEWAMEALDEVRREFWREAHNKTAALAKKYPGHKDRPRSDDTNAASVADAKEKAEKIKNSRYAFGKAPEHLTESQQIKIEMIAKTDKRLYRAFLMKESLHILLKLKDPDKAREELNHWLF